MTLRELRLSHTKSLGEVAKELAVSSPALSRWESGSRTPTMANTRKLAEYFGIHPREMQAVIFETAMAKDLVKEKELVTR